MKTAETANILIVDDTPANVFTMQALLDDMELNILTAGSGREALNIIESEDIALVLLDVCMPIMDGYQVIEIMGENENSSSIPVILVTASYMEIEDVFHGYRSGAIDFLLKPLNPIILKSKISVFIKLYNQKIRIKNQRDEIEQKNKVLQEQLDEIVKLRSILPICASCNKIRDENGIWAAPEVYFSEKMNVDYSHGICPECAKKLYPQHTDN